MVALFDGAAVPGAGSSQAYSTVVLIIPANGTSQVWSSIDGGNTWTRLLASAPWLVSADTFTRRGGSAVVDADNYIYYMGHSSLARCS